MEKELKWYHKIMAFISLFVCLLIFVIFGWSAFSTFMGKGGANGNMYLYYQLTQTAYLSYTSVVAIIAGILAFLISGSLARNSIPGMRKLLLLFLVFILLIIVCEVYLQTRFVGKG